MGLMDLVTEADYLRFGDFEKSVDDFALELTDVEQGVFDMLNELRERRGLQPLRLRSDVTEFSREWLAVCPKTAQGHLTNASHSDFGDHGHLFVDDRNGNGENLLFSTFRNLDSQELAELAHDGWVGSPIHFDNMTDPSFDEVGIAACQENNIWYFMQFFMSNR